jgi:hypothetical protein
MLGLLDWGMSTRFAEAGFLSGPRLLALVQACLEQKIFSTNRKRTVFPR